ncbi:thermonuclease family protein [Flavobacterium sp.]|jgi:micrococcal nuclease|uniref:thermonuclease family protein n=1 Tax=Flavobacterium sp. TaxID=239 RepID=UPI0037BEEC30
MDANNTITELENLDCSVVKRFSLKDMIIDAKVVSVYDGDTITIVFKLFENYYKWSCRLDGIDTPELKTKNIDEKQEAIRARDYLRSIIMNKIVSITCGDFDKYGRLLVTVFYNNDNVNNRMIQSGYAKSYHGGTKEAWEPV